MARVPRASRLPAGRTATPAVRTPVKRVVPTTNEPDAYKRIFYPPIFDGQKLTAAELPEDYDSKQHKPLRKKDFENEWDYFDYQAGEHERLAEKCAASAEQSRKMGTGPQRKSAKRALKLREQLNALVADLKAEGVDTDALLAETE